MEEQRSGPVVVYLDMNVWVSMARGCLHGDGEWIEARSALEAAVARGQVVVPLSAAHYLELWHRLEQRSREQVGGVMRDVTGYATISSPYHVRRHEVQTVVARLADKSLSPSSATGLLGHGAIHAFGSPHGRFRFVESLASPDNAVGEGPAVPPPDGWNALDRSGPGWEWLQLVGTPFLVENEGVERTPEHRYGTQHMQAELGLRERLTREPETRARLWDVIVTEELKSLLEDINETCEELAVDPHQFFLSGALGETPSESVHAFVEAVPSAFAWATLRYWKHRDLTHPWEQHDWTDISALSIAVPYCDVVITERRWAHIVTASRLAERYDTSVGHGLGALRSLVSSLS